MDPITQADAVDDNDFTAEAYKDKPTAIVIIGMAGSGKTTLARSLWHHLTKPQMLTEPQESPKNGNFVAETTSLDIDKLEADVNITDFFKTFEVASKSTNSVETSSSDSSTLNEEAIIETDEIKEKETKQVQKEGLELTAETSDKKTDINDCIKENEKGSIKESDKILATKPVNWNVKNASTITRNPLKTYVINLDPAVLSVPYPVNIDIRDSINIKDVMKHYNLGPNGAIMTSLNLFATKIDQLHSLLKKRASDLDYIMIDTPGQIEVFNWSASGAIILDSLAISYPTVILYVVDTVRCQNPITFMSNMLYACGLLYKAKLPFLMVFNKIDAHSPEQSLTWLKDYDTYAEDVLKNDSYMASLSRSCALVMNEFYSNIKTLGVSAATGLGFDQLEQSLKELREEFIEIHVPWLQSQKEFFKEQRHKSAQDTEQKFKCDILEN